MTPEEKLDKKLDDISEKLGHVLGWQAAHGKAFEILTLDVRDVMSMINGNGTPGLKSQAQTHASDIKAIQVMCESRHSPSLWKGVGLTIFATVISSCVTGIIIFALLMYKGH